uniref:Uncharacterized protein n=1 Tax=Strongyloides stercoralis TaxID=6248 RepID=A0A0K0E1Z6_STRER
MNLNSNKYLSNLREAKSTPYIYPYDTNIKSFKNNKESCFYSSTQLSLKDVNHDFIEKPKKIFFNAGCSSSSTDINKLIQFYNDSADLDVVAYWIKVYEDHKLKSRNKVLQNSDMKNNSSIAEKKNIDKNLLSYESFDSYDSDCDSLLMSLSKYKDKHDCRLKNFKDEKNIVKKNNCKINNFYKEENNCPKCGKNFFNNKRRFSVGYIINNRSLDDFTQQTKTKLSFKMPDDSLNLQKCASADFRSNKEKIIERRLERCEEMLNISSIGNDNN